MAFQPCRDQSRAGDQSPVHLDATWYTGAIAGSPLESALVAAGLDKVVGADQYGWGRVGRADNGGGWWGGCFNPASLFSARQVGNVLTLTNYGSDANIDCQLVFTKKK